MSSLPLPILRIKYEKAAHQYLRSLTLDDFMEATPKANQRKITLASLELVYARRPDVQTFNELLIQYPLPEDEDLIGRVVPDNMVVVHDEPIVADTSFDIPLQPVGRFWVMEYVSKSSERKDDEVSFVKYEQHLRVPYYLMYYPDNEEMTLFRLKAKRYVSVPRNGSDRCPIRELDMEVGMLDGWVRYWHKGELLPLPADLLFALEESQRQLAEAKREATNAKRQATKAQRLANDAERRAAEAEQRMEQERQARAALEQKLMRLRAERQDQD